MRLEFCRFDDGKCQSWQIESNFMQKTKKQQKNSRRTTKNFPSFLHHNNNSSASINTIAITMYSHRFGKINTITITIYLNWCVDTSPLALRLDMLGEERVKRKTWKRDLEERREWRKSGGVSQEKKTSNNSCWCLWERKCSDGRRGGHSVIEIVKRRASVCLGGHCS